MIKHDEPKMSCDEWLSLLMSDETTEIDSDAAEIIREIREYGEC